MKREIGMNMLMLFLAVLIIVVAGGCGEAKKEADAPADTVLLSQAAAVGMDNCLTCHSPFSTLIQDYLVSRHGNHMLAAAKIPNDTETPSADPSPGSCAYECHDPYNDRDKIDLAEIQAAVVAFGNDTKANWTAAASIVGCEGCHGGGQYHRGVGAIPFPVPGPKQCGQCHYLDDAIAKQEWIDEDLYPHHTTSSSGNNVRRNITDTHVDDPATTDFIEGYAIRYEQQNGCVDCHFNGHAFDLTINYQWAKSGHGGEIKVAKDAALAAGAPDEATLLANVTAAGSDGADFAWGHYPWDSSSRSSCQMCHSATGAMNFLNDPANYSAANNDFSHLVGWTQTTKDSGQNELLYCWACHSDSDGNLRNPGAITLSFTYNSVPVTLLNIGYSNVCVNCHGGRGNVDSMRDASRSSRFEGHHAPTAGMLFGSSTHTGFEYTGLVYDSTLENDGTTTRTYEHPLIGTSSVGSSSHPTRQLVGTSRGPCASCHMFVDATSEPNHTWSILNEAGTAINSQAVCDTCHGSMDVATLEALSDEYQSASALLNAYVANTITNYLGIDLNAVDPASTTNEKYYQTQAVEAYGAFQNGKLGSDEAAAFAHNSLYVKRLVFDAIDWMDNGALDGSITIPGTGYDDAATWFGTTPGSTASRPQ